MISEFVEYVKQVWKNKPNVSSPLNADRLNHMESGIENNSKKIKETVTAVNENTEKTDAALAIVGKPDEYSTSKTYAVGDKCIYENALYKCTTAISAAEAWTAGHWTKTSLCAEDAANKAAIKELTEKMYVSYDSVGIIVNESSDATEKKITISQDGFVQAMCKTGADRGQPFIRLQINKLAVFEGQAENATYRYLWTPLFPVKAGDVVIYTITNETSSGERTIRLYGYR